jgi:hypothetical protein
MYDKSRTKKVRLEGMSVDCFTTDTVKKKMLSLHGCSLDKFVVEKVGEDDKAIVFLAFLIYAPTSEEQIVWWYKHQGATVFAEFDATQASFAYGGEEDEAEEVAGDLVGKDPNDDPTAPIPGDKRKATLPTDKPGASTKRSHHAKKKT